MLGEFPESGKVNGHCKWPTYHADLSDLQTHGKYKSVKITKSFEEEEKEIATRLSKREGTLNITKDDMNIGETEVMSLISKLYNDRSKEARRFDLTHPIIENLSLQFSGRIRPF